MVKSGTWNSLPLVSTSLPYRASELTNWSDSLVSTMSLDCLLFTKFPTRFLTSRSLSEASEDREVEERDREGVSSGVAEMELEEDEGREGVRGVWQTFLREGAVLDMMKNMAG